jgi:hypothetical protein
MLMRKERERRLYKQLPAPDDEPHRKAGAPDCARPRALTDDAAAQRAPAANAAHVADPAVGPADPLPCGA